MKNASVSAEKTSLDTIDEDTIKGFGFKYAKLIIELEQAGKMQHLERIAGDLPNYLGLIEGVRISPREHKEMKTLRFSGHSYLYLNDRRVDFRSSFNLYAFLKSLRAA